MPMAADTVESQPKITSMAKIDSAENVTNSSASTKLLLRGFGWYR